MEFTKRRVYEQLRKMKKLFNLRYPKLAILIALICIAYIIFSEPGIGDLVNNIGRYGYLGNFIAGMLFSFGFTTPFAIGFFIVYNSKNILITAIIGGIGATISDLLIFKIVKFSFIDEFNRIKKTERIQELNWLITYEFGHKVRNYLMYVFAGLIIASPLPDELGVIMLAGLTKIKMKSFMIISFLFNTIGIYIMLNI